jgi:putative phosphoesterase
MSDTHDNLPMVRRAMSYFEGAGADCVIHAGDFVAPFALKEILKFKGPVYAVFGNNDGDHAGLRRLLPDLDKGPRHLVLCAKHVTIAHDEAKLRKKDLVLCDVLVVGHSHKPEIRAGRPLVINPGECGGWLGDQPAVATLDTETMEARIIRLGPPC